MIKPNPFTPQSGWEPKSFQGRDISIRHFTETLKKTIETKRPEHMIILGDWGVGKTSLLKQFKKITQKEGHLSSYCPIPKFTEKDNSSEIINLIAEEIIKGFPVINSIKKAMNEIEGIGLSIAGFGGEITRKKKISSPQIFLTDLLLQLWKHLKVKLAVILIDDVQNFNEVPQVLDILRLVLSRDEIITKTNYLFVLSSTPRGWDYFIDKHDPIGRFFRKRETIQCLSETETKKVVLETLKNSDVKFENSVISRIYPYTKGHPYELQVLCSNLYENQIKGRVSNQQWTAAFNSTIAELGRDYFASLYRKATDREETILQVLAGQDDEIDTKTIQLELLKTDKKYPAKDTRFYIYRLIAKGLVLQKNKGKYQLIDRMFKEYILSLT